MWLQRVGEWIALCVQAGAIYVWAMAYITPVAAVNIRIRLAQKGAVTKEPIIWWKRAFLMVTLESLGVTPCLIGLCATSVNSFG